MSVIRLALLAVLLGMSTHGGYASSPGHSAESYASHLKAAPLAWIIDIHDDKDGTPHGNLLLNVQGLPVMIARGIDEHFNVVSRSEYAERRFPRLAVLACSGWWAGAGDDFYVTRRGHRLRVYRREVDEGDNGHQRFRLVKTIRLSA